MYVEWNEFFYLILKYDERLINLLFELFYLYLEC